MARKRKKKKVEAPSIDGLLSKLGITRNREIVDALRDIKAGDTKLYRKIVEGHDLDHKDSEELRKQMLEINKNLDALRKAFKNAPGFSGGSNPKPAPVTILGPDGRPVENKAKVAERERDEKGRFKTLKDMSLTFQQTADLFQKQIKTGDLDRKQVRFLLEKLVEIGDANGVKAESFDELKTIVKDQNSILDKDDGMLSNILDAVKDETAENKTNLNLKSIQDQLEQANEINKKLEETDAERKRREDVDRLKEKRVDKALSTGGSVLGGLFGLPILDDLKDLKDSVKTISGIVRSIPGIGVLGKLAGPAAAAALGVAIGKGIGVLVIDPIFKYLKDKDRAEANKQVAKLREKSQLITGDSEESEQQSRTNLAYLESAAASGVFGSGSLKLTAKEQMEALPVFNKALADGKSQDQALEEVNKNLSQIRRASTYSSGGMDALRQQRRQEKADKPFAERLESFKKTVQPQDVASAASAGGPAAPTVGKLPTAASTFRDSVVGQITAAPGQASEGGLARTTSATAEGIASQLGAGKLDEDQKTGELTVDILKSMERFEPVLMSDPAGRPAIGYGHDLMAHGEDPEKYRNVKLTEAEATELLRKDIKEAQSGAIKGLKVPVSAEQMSAMTIMAFNLGANHANLKKVVSMTNAGDYKGAAEQFLNPALTTAKDINTGERKVLPGLIKRRGTESALFLAGAEAFANQQKSQDGAVANQGAADAASKISSAPAVKMEVPAAAPVPTKASSVTVEPAPKAQASFMQTQAASMPVPSRPVAVSTAPAPTQQPVIRPAPGKKTGVNELSLAIIKNGMLDGV